MASKATSSPSLSSSWTISKTSNAALETSLWNFYRRQRAGGSSDLSSSSSSYLRLSSVVLDEEGLWFLVQSLESILPNERPKSLCLDHCDFSQQHNERYDPTIQRSKEPALTQFMSLLLRQGDQNGLEHLRLWGPTSHIPLQALVTRTTCTISQSINYANYIHSGPSLITFQLHDITFQGYVKGNLLKDFLQQHGSCLEHVELQRCYMDMSSMQPFAQGLASLTSLQSLSLWNSTLSDAMLSCLVLESDDNSLTYQYGLKRFILRDNSLTSRSLPVLTFLISQLPSLETFDVSYNRDLLNYVGSSSVRHDETAIRLFWHTLLRTKDNQLQCLQVRACGIDNSVANILFDVLQQQDYHLNKLDLGGNVNMKPDCFKSLAKIDCLKNLILPCAIPVEWIRCNTNLLELRFDQPLFSFATDVNSTTSQISSSSVNKYGSVLEKTSLKLILHRNRLLQKANQIIIQERQHQLSKDRPKDVHQISHDQNVGLSFWPLALHALSGDNCEGSTAVYAIVQSILREHFTFNN